MLRPARGAAAFAAAAAFFVLPAYAGAATIALDPGAADEAVSTDGECSLREAVNAANQDDDAPANALDCTGTVTPFGKDLILVPGDVATGLGGGEEDLNLGGDYDVSDDLTVRGTGVARSLIDTAAGRVFEVTAASLALRHVRISGGAATATPPDAPQGGAVRFVGGSGDLLDLLDSELSGNVATPDAGSTARGGAIYFQGNSSLLAIEASEVSQNSAGGGAADRDGQGGGVWAGGTAVATTISSSEISNNAAGGGGADSTGSGGGLLVDTGGVSTVNMVQLNVEDNQAGGGAAGATGQGGGVNVLSQTPTTLTNTTLRGNSAGGAPAAGSGGGVKAAGNLILTSAVIDQNQAGPGSTGSGGGIDIGVTPGLLVVNASQITGNSAGSGGGIGGGIQTQGSGGLRVASSTIAGNSAPVTGGGIYRATASPVNDYIEASSISSNTAGTFGGGVYVANDSGIAISNSTIDANTASGPGSPLGGGILAELATPAGTGSLAIINTTVAGNSANGAAGGNGGGIANDGPGSPIPVGLTSSTVAGNTAGASGAGGAGGNLFAAGSGLFDLRGSIIAGGGGDPGAENCFAASPGAFDSAGGNVEATIQCGLDQPGDVVGTDPLLGALAANGGATRTMALASGSPAIDLVPAGVCPLPTTDQRGSFRPQGAGCDAGAYEAPSALAPVPKQARCKKGFKLKKVKPKRKGKKPKRKCVKKTRKKRR